MEYRLAIDIGASSGRHILGHYEGDTLVTEEIYRFPNGYETRDGMCFWNTDDLFGNICAGIRRCAEIGKLPASIAIDTWGVDYALLDAAGNAVGGLVAYRDPRTSDIPEKVYRIIPKRELYSRTGIAEHTFNTIFQLYADKLSGRLDNAEDMLFVPCYLNYLLTGVRMNEYTFASTTGLVNAATRDWDLEVIDRLGLPRKLFGELHQPGETVGDLLPEIAGFSCPVILAAAHDTASAVAAIGKRDVLWISSGTWSLIGTETEQPILTPAAEDAGFTNEGGLGGRIRFLENIIGSWIIQSIKRRRPDAPGYNDLMLMAEESGYEYPLDVNDQSLLAPENMESAVLSVLKKQGYPTPGSLGDLMRSVYLGLAHAYADACRKIEALTGKKFDEIHIVGGGSRDRLLNALTDKISGRKVLIGDTEATSTGNLLVQFGKAL